MTMALLNKLLTNRKGNLSAFERLTALDSSKEWKPPNFIPADVRLVIYADNDRERKLFYDSKAIKKVDPPIAKKKAFRRNCTPSAKENEQATRSFPKLQVSHPGSDVNMFEEIMFGSVGIAYTGSALKVHLTKSPPQLMLTKVFVPENHRRECSCELDSDSYNFNNHSYHSDSRNLASQNDTDSILGQSVPMDVPCPGDSRKATFDIIDEDSGLASLTSSGSFHSLQTPFPSPGSSGSYSTLQRRKNRIRYTSLESSLKKKSSHDNLLSHDSSGPSSLSSNSSSSCRKKTKLALGILFRLSDDTKDEESNKLFENFFFSHITLLEGHLEKLKSAVEVAFYNQKQFFPLVYEALEVFRTDVRDLFITPRLSEPVWLNMMAYSNYRYAMSEKFIKQFMSMASKYDSKNTNFFMSTLITAVLTHHLAWVPTVTPAGGTSIRTYLHNHSPNWVDTFAKTHPYNPLWAQLGDLYGAIGFPLKIARTVVVGKKADLVNKLLYILTYFIRCSDVKENEEIGSLNSCLGDLSFELEEDKQDITPIREDEGFTFPKVSNMQANAPQKIITHQNSVLSMETLGSLSSTSVGSQQTVLDWEAMRKEKVDKNFALRKFVESQTTITDESENKENNRISQNEFHDFISSDEGYFSLMTSEKKDFESSGPCKLIGVDVPSSVPVEKVRNVSRSSTCLIDELHDVTNHLPPNLLECSNEVVTSVITQPKVISPTPISKSEIKEKYLQEGSHSIFDEYMNDDEIETKTIDIVDTKDRVISSHLIPDECMKTSTDSISKELAETVPSQNSEQQSNNHDSRLGSFTGGIRPRMSSLSRQLSSERGISGRPTTLNPGRCRSVTPTELGRRRHVSTTSSFDVEHTDPLHGYKELEMPSFVGNSPGKSITTFDRNFGRSLLAGYCDRYMSDFVLHGTSENNFTEKLRSDLQVSVQHSVLDEPIGEAVCIIADTDKWTVEVGSSTNLDKAQLTTPVIYSQLVSNLIEAVLQLWKLKMSPEFCLMHLEDRLQEIFFKSKMLAEYLKDTSKKKCNIKELSVILGFEPGDLPLLVAIAGTHSPHLSLGVI